MVVEKFRQYARRAHANRLISICLARGAASASARAIDPTRPESWEFSAFSQNGEDGIVDFLTRKAIELDRTFIEVGSSNGIENNSAWFAIGRKFRGWMIDGNEGDIGFARDHVSPHSLGTSFRHCYVTKSNVIELLHEWKVKSPGVFSLDVDGMDFHIVKSLLEHDFAPTVVVVEYNSAFGPDQSLTIPYQDTFNFKHASDSGLFYGVSVTAWRNLFVKHGYTFVCVDANGVNAIFVKTDRFDPTFIDQLIGYSFRENFYQEMTHGGKWQIQWRKIQNMEFIEVE